MTKCRAGLATGQLAIIDKSRTQNTVPKIVCGLLTRQNENTEQ